MPFALDPTPRRDADCDLYDHGCDLVTAAVAIRTVVDRPGAVTAAPALLGCLEAAISEIGLACLALERSTGELAESRNAGGERANDRMRRSWGNLRWALEDAERAAKAARALVARALVGRATAP